MTDAQKLDAILRHIDNVRENCELLGRKLIEQGRTEFGRVLIANGLKHDNSKLFGIEWEYMDPTTTNKVGLKHAMTQHQKTNEHHPEYWGGIENMPEIYLAELACDWKARSTEFGNSLRDWIEKDALKKFKFTKESQTYKTIMSFIDLLCDKPFEVVEEIPLNDSSTKIVS